MKQSQLEVLFELPPREAKTLSFCKADKATLSEWAEALPMADIGKSTRMLYGAINEVCQLSCSPALRVDLADAIRPAIHYVCKGLKKSYMNQPVIMPAQPRKIANLCQALQSLLAKAYLISACQCNEKMSAILKKPTALMARSIYLAMDEYTRILVRNYILYRPYADNFWMDIHRLYQLGLHFQLNELAVLVDCPGMSAELADENMHEFDNINHVYMKLLLWGCVKANQLRQEDVVKIDKYIDEWSKDVKLTVLDKGEDTAFVVDPQQDLPPIYQKFYRGDYNSACQALDTDKLIEQLKTMSDTLNKRKDGIPTNVINHLILAWGIFTGRTFMRLEAQSQLNLCIGLSCLHYFLANRRAFNEIVHGEFQGDNKQIGAVKFKAQLREAEKLDVWDRSLYGTEEKSSAQETMESIDFQQRKNQQVLTGFSISSDGKYPTYEVDMVNMSPGGYCLEWNNDIPNTIKAGEIIGVREEHHNTLNIGVIRWVRQRKAKSLRIGVELLSPNAKPYGARVANLQGKPQSDFMRALILPEIKTAGQPSSIITPAVSFKAGQHILLAKESREHTIMLKKMLSSTGSYSQFTFDDVRPSASSSTIDDTLDTSSHSDLDSVWDLL